MSRPSPAEKAHCRYFLPRSQRLRVPKNRLRPSSPQPPAGGVAVDHRVTAALQSSLGQARRVRNQTLWTGGVWIDQTSPRASLSVAPHTGLARLAQRPRAIKNGRSLSEPSRAHSPSSLVIATCLPACLSLIPVRSAHRTSQPYGLLVCKPRGGQCQRPDRVQRKCHQRQPQQWEWATGRAGPGPPLSEPPSVGPSAHAPVLSHTTATTSVLLRRRRRSRLCRYRPQWLHPHFGGLCQLPGGRRRAPVSPASPAWRTAPAACPSVTQYQ
jgi:hypothetical protein